VDRDYGSLEQGKAADFVVMDKELNVKQVYVAGKKVVG
jgi:N-acetylglucosamine-6-phosphate deacetylase